MNKLIASVVATAVVFGGGAFLGGMYYAQNKVAQERQARVQQFGVQNPTGGQRGMRGGNGGPFTAGEIIAKDDKSITVKLRDGGSKIVFYSETTEIGKTATVTPSDLAVGTSVMVNGTANSDGSVTAQSIQIRPEGTPFPAGR